MPSKLLHGQSFGIHDDQHPPMTRSDSSRRAAAPVGSSIDHSSWNGIDNIWKTQSEHQVGKRDIGSSNGLHGKSENMVESQLTHEPISPDRHDSLSKSRLSNMNNVPEPREQKLLTCTNGTYRQNPTSLPPVTSSGSGQMASVMQPNWYINQGPSTLGAKHLMSTLSNATLLSGSAPDIEHTFGPVAYTNRSNVENKLRTLDIGGVHEFIPQQQTHSRIQERDTRAVHGKPTQSFEFDPTPIKRNGFARTRDGVPASLHDFNPLNQRTDSFLNRFSNAPNAFDSTSNGYNHASHRVIGEYEWDNSSTRTPQANGFSMPRFPGDQLQFQPGQSRAEAYARGNAWPVVDQSNTYRMLSHGTANGYLNPQAPDQQYHTNSNKNAYFANNGLSIHAPFEPRNDIRTPSLTPPSGPESQRSASGSGPSIGSLNHAPDPRIRNFENGQTASHSRIDPAPGYVSQRPQEYFQGYHHQATYTEVEKANGMVNAMGPRPYEIHEQREDPDKPISPFLKEFKANCKTKRYELKDVYGYIVEFSGDQHGSRFIQGKLETANSDEKEQVFIEIHENACQLMTDIFGNYVIQKLFEHGTQAQKKGLANQMKGRVLYLTTQVYGCRVVQKALEHVLTDQQASMVKELEGSVLGIVENQNGNHVIQKAIERVPGDHIQFVVEALRGQIVRLAKHNYGCRVVQRMLEHGQPSVKDSILAELHANVPALIADTFGNYVVQHIIRHGNPADRFRVVSLVQQQLLFYSKHKFASNVVEAAIEKSDDNQRQEILRGLTGPDHNGQTPVYNLIRDQYGNYVIQKVLQRLEGAAKDALIKELRYHLVTLRRVSHGKQVSAIEKAISEATDGHVQLSPPRAIHNSGYTARHMAPTSYYPPRMQCHPSMGMFPQQSVNGVRP